MNPTLTTIIEQFSTDNISNERKEVLAPLIKYIQAKKNNNQSIRLNFICTHNSRRSHLSQIWAQTLAYYFDIKDISCYSGGTESTAMFSKVVETLLSQGFEITQLSQADNPIYMVKYDSKEPPIICFSKEYNHTFNPSESYGAVVTCNSADEACPLVLGAEARFSVKYDDPKIYDDSDLMNQKYAERSLEIGEEMWYVFSQI